MKLAVEMNQRTSATENVKCSYQNCTCVDCKCGSNCTCASCN